MLLNLFLGGFAVYFISVLIYLGIEFKTFNLTERLTFKKLIKRLWEEKVLIICGFIPLLQYFFILVILYEIERIKKKGAASISDKLGINLNKMYECTNPECKMICREYHLIKNSEFEVEKTCPFCKTDEYAIIEMGEKYDKISKLSFAEAIPEGREKEFLIETKQKWLDIENKRVELEGLKLSYELEKRQMDNYLRLNSNKADKMVSEYEEKLANLQSEYESFSQNIEGDVLAYLYGNKKA